MGLAFNPLKHPKASPITIYSSIVSRSISSFSRITGMAKVGIQRSHLHVISSKKTICCRAIMEVNTMFIEPRVPHPCTIQFSDGFIILSGWVKETRKKNRTCFFPPACNKTSAEKTTTNESRRSLLYKYLY